LIDLLSSLLSVLVKNKYNINTLISHILTKSSSKETCAYCNTITVVVSLSLPSTSSCAFSRSFVICNQYNAPSTALNQITWPFNYLAHTAWNGLTYKAFTLIKVPPLLHDLYTFSQCQLSISFVIVDVDNMSYKCCFTIDD